MVVRKALDESLETWLDAWEGYDIDGVVTLFDEDVVFEHWDGARIEGKELVKEGPGPPGSQTTRDSGSSVRTCSSTRRRKRSCSDGGSNGLPV